MAVTSGFYNSLNGDRKYNSEQFSALFDSLIIDGVFANIGTAFAVTVTSDTTLTVGVGRAWFNSTWLYNDTLLPMTPMDAEILLNRIDAIVIEINHNQSVRNGQIRWVYGNPANEPQRPVLTNTDEVHQYPLAYVYRKAGVNKMTQADVTNMIGSSSCPYVSGILSTQNIDNVVAQWQTQFNLFMDGLEESLSGDVASNLTSQVLELQERFRDLASDQAVYEPLQDSSGNVIKDSYNGDVLAATSLGGGDGTVIVNYASDKDVTNDDISAVGDIVDTARTDMSSDWALCNGATLARSSYAELSDLIPVTPEGPWSSKMVASGTSDQDIAVTKVLKLGSYYVALPFVGSNNYPTITTPYIYYATSMGGTWTKKTFGSGTYNYTIFEDMLLLNGRLVIIGGAQKTSDNETHPTIWYSTAPASTWTEKIIVSSTGSSMSSIVTDMIYESSQYRCVFSYTNSSRVQKIRIGYSSNLSTWTLYSDLDISSSIGVGQKVKLLHIGNQFILAAHSNSGFGSPFIYYASNLNATSWTQASSIPNNIKCAGICALDGKLIFYGQAGSSLPAIYIADDPPIDTGSNIGSLVTFPSISGSTKNIITDLIYAGGFYVACGRYEIDPASGSAMAYRDGTFVAYSKSLYGPWTVNKDLPVYTGNYSGGFYRPNCAFPTITHNGTTFMLATGDVLGNPDYDSRAFVAWVNESMIQLPSISSESNFYSYIKIR